MAVFLVLREKAMALWALKEAAHATDIAAK